jgi:hypothetical protein
MKYLKMIGLAGLAALAVTAFVGVGTASATTLEIAGATQNKAVTLVGSLKAGTSANLKTTSGSFQNTCTGSNVHGTTEIFTGHVVTGKLTEKENGLKFTGCANSVTVHNAGALEVTHIAGTTNGTVFSENAEVTVFSAEFGTYLNCKTGATTHIGTLTGVASAAAHATLNVNAVLNCGFFVPSAKWEATYTITTPTGLGVSA